MTLQNQFKIFLERYNEAWNHFPEYRSALFWILRDLFLAFPWSMISMVAFSMIGASLQGFALVAAIKYVSFLERSIEINFAGINFAARSGEMLSLAALGFFVLMCFSSWLLYLGGVTASKLISKYQVYLLKRAVSLFGTVVPGATTPKSSSAALQLISNIVMKDVQKSGMLVRFMASVPHNIIMLMYAFPILVYIDLSLTLILVCVVMMFFPLFYQANVMAYESDLMAKRSGKGATQSLMSLMEDIKDFQYISPKQIKIINKAFNKKELKDKINYLPVYFISISRTDLWSNILLGLCVSLVIVIQVPASVAGATTWASLIAYLTFLRQGVHSFKGIMSFFTKFSRFYPYVHRYQHFVQSALGRRKGDNRIVIKTAADGIFDQYSEIEIEKPVVMALTSNVPLSRYSFPYMIKLGANKDNGIFVSPQECFFIGSKGLPQRDGSLRSMLNLPEGFSDKDLKQTMPKDVYEAVRNHIGTNPDKNAGKDKWEKICLAHRVEMGVVAALINPARVVVIDENTLKQIPENRCRELLYQIKRLKALTIISYPENRLKNDEYTHQFSEELFAVAGCTGNLLALGPPRWVEQNREQILDLLEKEKVRLKQGTAEDGVDDYDDMDDD